MLRLGNHRPGIKDMRLATILVFGVLAACATPAPDKAATTSADQGERVCKRITMTGSNMPTKQCRSAAEWALVEKAGQADVEEFERARDEITSVGQ
jgi:hypothetical protein